MSPELDSPLEILEGTFGGNSAEKHLSSLLLNHGQVVNLHDLIWAETQ